MGFLWVGLAWSQTLPQGAQVVQGTVGVSQSGNQMAITQGTAKAVVNWQSFDIGQNAKVTVVQPSSQSVLLNRVLSDNPTQILGQLQANGQVVLVNPRGIVVGSDGSVSASAFTASSLNISDADFMAGKEHFTRNGSTGRVVNKGRIAVAPRGYVALLGTNVSNEGQIIAPQGAVTLGAAETISVPLGRTGKIKLELTPASINASVANQKGGVIVAEGGQVYLQAAALSQVLASVLNSGSIDTSGPQAGAVHLLADGGRIQVDGQIKANSSGQDDQGQARTGGDIFIGLDKETRVLAKFTDVSGAQLESVKGFVETSGSELKFDAVSVVAKDWLIDPQNVTIDSTNAGTIGSNLGTTSITIQTTGATLGTTSVGNGNITVNSAITKAAGAGADTTLTLLADNAIDINAAIGTAAGAGKLNVVMTANGQTDGVAVGAMTPAQRGLSGGIRINNSSINANGGDVSLTGTSYAASSNLFSNVGKGVLILNGSSINATNITITGTAENQVGVTSHGVVFQRYPQSAALTATGDIAITGTLQGSGSGSGVVTLASGWSAAAPMINAGGKFTLRGNNRASANNTSEAINANSGMQVRAVGNIVVQAETNNATVNAIKFYSRPATTWGVGGALEGNVSFRSLDAGGAASGNVVIQSNRGGILFDNQIQANLTSGSLTALTNIRGKNITIDNTGAGMVTGVANTLGSGSIDPSTGVITKGTGTSTSVNSGIKINDGRTFSAPGNINIYGVGSSGSGVELSGAVQLSASKININGENTGAGGAAINISNTSSKLMANTVVLTAGGTGSGTSLVAAGSIAVPSQLQITTPATGTISGIVSGAGKLTKLGTGTVTLTADNSYAGTTTISGGTLQVGNAGSTGTLGGGDVTLANNANLSYVLAEATTIANNISGAGNVSASITGATSDLTVNRGINLDSGTVNLVTDRNLLVNQAISTSNGTSSAVLLLAGKTTNAGTAMGGDVQIAGSGSVAAGTNGRITYMTGSIAGSTGLGVMAGNNRYNSDEVTTNYTTALGSGAYTIYREKPLVTVQVSNVSQIYDGIGFSGGALEPTLVSGALLNGETLAAVTANVGYAGASQGAKNASATPYAITASETGGKNALGYGVTYNAGSLTINKANLTLSGTRVYDATTSFAGEHLTATGVNGETFTLTGTGDATNLASKNVQTNQALRSVTGLALGTSGNGGLSSNYNDLSTTGSSVSVTPKALTLTAATDTKTYDGNTNSSGIVNMVGLQGSDTASATQAFASKNVLGAGGSTLQVNSGYTITDGNSGGNYTVSTATATGTINKANLTLSGTRVYDATT
ncbi:MAG: filamentous hemagglutinin N-terminal domain-containing protein, partial [Limnohabitans sp.]|nr:filamentous hemagglutinin N-terminal domain-containing protein [Limnohabitans sp.]